MFFFCIHVHCLNEDCLLWREGSWESWWAHLFSAISSSVSHNTELVPEYGFPHCGHSNTFILLVRIHRFVSNFKRNQFQMFNQLIIFNISLVFQLTHHYYYYYYSVISYVIRFDAIQFNVCASRITFEWDSINIRYPHSICGHKNGPSCLGSPLSCSPEEISQSPKG